MTPTAARTRALKPRVLALAVAIVMTAAAVWFLIPSASLMSGRFIAWRVFLPPSRTSSTIMIEADRPYCLSDNVFDDSLFEPVVAYTPVSVTIRLRVLDSIPECPVTVGGRMPIRLGFYYTVHLSEPLAGRPLFDGSSFPAAARPY